MKLTEAVNMWETQQAQLHSLVAYQPIGVLDALNHVKEHVKRECTIDTPAESDIERMKKYALWIDCLTTLILQYRKDTEEKRRVFKGVIDDIEGMLQRI